MYVWKKNSDCLGGGCAEKKDAERKRVNSNGRSEDEVKGNTVKGGWKGDKDPPPPCKNVKKQNK